MQRVDCRLLLAGFTLSLVQAGNAHAEQTFADMLFDASQTVVKEGDILTGPRAGQRGVGVRGNASVWVDGIVPYYLDPALPIGSAMAVLDAVDTWNELSGVRLIEIDPSDANAPKDYVYFEPATGCASWVGRQGGAQSIWVAPSCSAGSMMHEIGHAIGLEHEHTRADRDQYIQINFANVDADKRDNFAISDSSKQNHGPYDFGSIMHYGPMFFSANGQPTIEPLHQVVSEMGQRIAPSKGDIAAVAAMYSSDLSLATQVISELGQTEITLHVTNEQRRGAHELAVDMNIGEARLLANNNAAWNCSTYNGTLTCTSERLAGVSKSVVVLNLDSVVNESELNATLVSKTPDSDLSNNGDVKLLAAQSFVQPFNDSPATASAGSVGYYMWSLAAISLVRIRRRTRDC